MATKKETKSKPVKKTAAQAKDLPAKKNAKGGARGEGFTNSNHNETRV